MKLYIVEVTVRAENESDAIERIEDMMQHDEENTIEGYANVVLWSKRYGKKKPKEART